MIKKLIFSIFFILANNVNSQIDSFLLFDLDSIFTKQLSANNIEIDTVSFSLLKRTHIINCIFEKLDTSSISLYSKKKYSSDEKQYFNSINGIMISDSNYFYFVCFNKKGMKTSSQKIVVVMDKKSSRLIYALYFELNHCVGASFFEYCTKSTDINEYFYFGRRNDFIEFDSLKLSDLSSFVLMDYLKNYPSLFLRKINPYYAFRNLLDGIW